MCVEFATAYSDVKTDWGLALCVRMCMHICPSSEVQNCVNPPPPRKK
jgi:hypothetical protein